MLKCLFCPATFEPKAFSTTAVDENEKKRAELGRIDQATEMERWGHATMTVTRDGGRSEVLSGHICPDDRAKIDAGATIKVSL
jgi:hypothetical protein